MTEQSSEKFLSEQIHYYDERAPEYDDWFFRLGRFDRGEDHRKLWETEVRIVRNELARECPNRLVLEVACGTGLWTEVLARSANRVVCVDASEPMLTRAKSRVGSATVEFIHSDIYHWKPEKQFDLIFFGFWISHIPTDRFENFWSFVNDALAAGGTVFFVDSLYNPETSAKDHPTPSRSGIVERKLNDGRSYSIIKIFHEPEDLQSRLEALGWTGQVQPTGEFFYYGRFRKAYPNLQGIV